MSVPMSALSAPASPFTPASLRSEQLAERRSFTGGLPVLPTDEPVRGAGASPMGMTQPGVASRGGQSDVASRFAAPMLTSFPRASSEPETPRMLWPQVMSNASERLQRLLSILPTGWQPPPSVVAAVSASGVAGMPFWQRMPQVAVSPQPERGAAPSPQASQKQQQQASLPKPLLSLPNSRDDERRVAAQDVEAEEDPRSAVRRPAMTVLEGDEPRSQRRAPTGRPAAPPAPTSVGQPPEIAMLSAALKASGANQDQIAASMTLVEAMRSQGTSRPGRTDDRLNLGDLTMIALTMGQNRMAAANSGAMSAYTRVGSIEKALHMHPSEHPRVKQEDTDLMKKVDSMTDQVMKMMDRLKKDQKIRGGHGM
jgi:hypothetical protein